MVSLRCLPGIDQRSNPEKNWNAMRLNILISAYYCSPYRGGESAVGWRIATGLAKHHDVTVICGDLAANGPTGADVARFAKEEGLPPGLKIHHIQAEGWTRKIHDLHAFPGLWFLFYEAYRRWQLQALKLARVLHAEKPFALVHHVNVIGFREPGYLWQMGIPFFWGPVSGAPMIPLSFLKDFSRKEKFRWGSRNLLNQLQIRLAGRAAKAARAAAKVWVVSKEDQQVFDGWGVKAEPMLETGCAVTEGILPRRRENGESLRLCWSGLFQGIKALPVLLRAMSSCSYQNTSLEVLGDGVEVDRWKKLAKELGISERVQWLGMLTRDQALDAMNRSHVLVHSSVKEGTPHVVLEALAMGMPVVCHDACGMGTAVTPDCGIKVPLRNPATSHEGFRDALEKFHADPSLLETLSRGAIKRAGELTWENKISRYTEAYLQSHE
jgi:glycosyltransferase involved in cell wall biosynthesis